MEVLPKNSGLQVAELLIKGEAVNICFLYESRKSCTACPNGQLKVRQIIDVWNGRELKESDRLWKQAVVQLNKVVPLVTCSCKEQEIVKQPGVFPYE